MKQSVALIGPGKVGCAISRLLQQAGYPIRTVISRNRGRALEACEFIGCPPESASIDPQDGLAADIILLAVPDDHIQHLATEVIEQTVLYEATTLVHFSGLHPAAIMQTTPSSASLLSIHPLLPFADRELAVAQLPTCPCALEGSENALALGREIIAAIGGQFFEIPSQDKALYHASACVASNYFVTLLETACDLLTQCQIDRDRALQLLLPLVLATFENVAQYGLEKGLTGPIVRGDSRTVATHLQALEKSSPENLALYRMLGQQTLGIAQQSGRLSREKAQAIATCLEGTNVTAE